MAYECRLMRLSAFAHSAARSFFALAYLGREKIVLRAIIIINTIIIRLQPPVERPFFILAPRFERFEGAPIKRKKIALSNQQVASRNAAIKRQRSASVSFRKLLCFNGALL